MGSIEQSNGVNDGQSHYPVPSEAASLLQHGLLKTPLVRKDLPQEAADFSKNIRYVGSDEPHIPINWRFAESAAALKGLEATLANCLLRQKYGVEPKGVVINTYATRHCVLAETNVSAL